MNAVPATPEACDLLHQGTIALAEVECNGMRVDVPYLETALKEAQGRIKIMRDNIAKSEVMKEWKKKYRDDINTESADQLGDILFNVMGYDPPEKTAGGKRYKTDEKTLALINDPFVNDYLAIKKLEKMCNTNIKGILREVVDGKIHCFFSLHTVVTYRSCVAKGTMIEVVRDVAKHPKGIAIENVRAGDYVYCYNNKRQLTVRKVLWAGKTGHRKVVRLHWVARGKKGYIDVTPEHKIRMVDGTYQRADELMRMPVTRVLAMGRSWDRIWQTGTTELLDHRLVYESLIGPTNGKVIHHKDGNHYNNVPSNLALMKLRDHSRLHSDTVFTDDGRRKGVRQRQKNHQLYGDRWPSGNKNARWVGMTKFGLLRKLSYAGGRAARTDLSFVTIKRIAKTVGVDLETVKLRYDHRGMFISRGWLLRCLREGRTAAMSLLGVNFYKLKQLMEGYKIPVTRKWGNQFGSFTPHNHQIVRMEYLEEKVDVYDLEVEGEHNFIANEICVHNSSSDFNFQNLPIRNEEIARIVRRAFIPRKGRRIVEHDFKGAEVLTAACYHKDPTMIAYLKDKSKDMHRDMAMDLYKLPQPEVTKEIRHRAKNQFVFPQFYGSWFAQCAPILWREAMKLKTTSGMLLSQHLQKMGFSELGEMGEDNDPPPGTFLHHVKRVERIMWDRRFPVYSQWKVDWYNEYLKQGWFQTLTGFVCRGFMEKNDVINYPVQGSSFHCLLWSLIQLVKEELKRRRMKTLIVGQIHDSIVADVPDEEFDEYNRIVRDVTEKQLKQHFKWLILPMEIECEAAPVGAAWCEKKKVE